MTRRRGLRRRGRTLKLRQHVRGRSVTPRRLDGFVFGRIPDARRAFQTAAKAAGLGRLCPPLPDLFASRLADRGAGRHELTEAGG